MGFFNTSTDERGDVQFSVSNRWWLFIATSVPLTAVTLSALGGWTVYKKWRKMNLVQINPDDDDDPMGKSTIV